jgi:hypothetical protein
MRDRWESSVKGFSRLVQLAIRPLQFSRHILLVIRLSEIFLLGQITDPSGERGEHLEYYKGEGNRPTHY